MSTTPKVSVVIPVYNGADFLFEAINSVLNQSYKNIEIIVVNDGSNDNGKTSAICKKFGNKIKYFEKNNGGVSSALNFGIKRASGLYFAWLSHDDVFLRKKIEDQLKIATKSTIVFSRFCVADQNLNNRRPIYYNNLHLANFRLWLISYKMMHGCTVLVPMHIMRKNLFNEKLKVVQDYDLWLRLSEFTPFILLNKVTLLSRLHKEQHSNCLTYQNKIEVKNFLIKQLDILFKSLGGTSFDLNSVKVCVFLICRFSLLGNKKEANYVFLWLLKYFSKYNSLFALASYLIFLLFYSLVASLAPLLRFFYFNLKVRRLSHRLKRYFMNAKL